MKCPKCEYISFDSAGRCRNCGYDFSLAHVPSPEDDLPIRAEREPEGSLADFVLQRGRSRGAAAAAQAIDIDRLRVSPAPGRDLPLFGEEEEETDDEPLLVRPARSPLSVRRPTPEVVKLRDRLPRPRPETALPRLDLDPDPLEEEDEPYASVDEAEVEETVDQRADDAEAPAFQAAGVPARLGAAVFDLTLLAGVDAVVIYLTLQIAGLTAWELRVIPPIPLLGFFAILNGGYGFALTAAGGRTLGKILTGVQVIDRDGGPVTLGQSAVRTASYLVSAAPAGLGFLIALFGAERLALHDRLAATRVIKS